MDGQRINKLILLLLCCNILSSIPLAGQWETLIYPGFGEPFPAINDIAFFDEQNGVGVGDNGAIVRTEDGGQSWENVNSPITSHYLTDIKIIEGATAIAIGRIPTFPLICGDNPNAGVIIRTQDGGKTWSTIFVSNFHLSVLSFPSPEVGYIAANCGRVLKSTDGGLNWTFTNAFPAIEATGLSLQFIDNQVGFLSFTSGNPMVEGLFKTLDGGDNWTEISPPGYSSFYGAVYFLDDQLGYLSVEGDLLETTDGGQNWNMLIDNAVSVDLYRSPTGNWYHSAANFANLTRITLDGSVTEFQEASDPSTDDYVRAKSLFFINDWIYAVAHNRFYRTNTAGATPGYHYLQGRIARDNDNNCTHDSLEVGLDNWTIRATGDAGTFWALSDSTGAYELEIDTGDYEVHLFAPNETWLICQNDFNLDLSEPLGHTTQHFSIQPNTDCPKLSIEISSGQLISCQNNRFYIQYANQGSGTAIATQASIMLDPAMEIVGSDLTWTNPEPLVYEFALGDIPTDSSGLFWVDAFLDCSDNGASILLGQTHCVEARIQPDSLCTTPDPNWSGADLEVSGVCEGDSVIFTIINKGTAILNQVSDFVIIEDHVLLQDGSVYTELALGDTSFVFHPNGATLRMELDQAPFHPRRSFPSVSVEACGLNAQGGISLGFVNQFPEDDQELSVAILCQESSDQIETSIVSAFPKGYAADHSITPFSDLEYLIRFQNDGVDTVRQLEIFDTLSPRLDLSRLQAPVGTHPFRWELLESGVLHIVFEDIALPPSSQDATRAYGSIQFSIPQYPGNLPGALIVQQVGIVMNFELRHLAQYTHTIEENSIPMLDNVSINGSIENILGTPMSDITVQLKQTNQNLKTDSLGQFSFTDLPYFNPYQVLPQYSLPQQVISAHDLFLLHHHIQETHIFADSKKYFQADLNADGKIDQLDQEQLRSALLHSDSSNDESGQWRFLPKPNLQNYPPLQKNATEIRNPTSHNELDLIAFLPGDLNDDFDREVENGALLFDQGLLQLNAATRVRTDGSWEVMISLAEAVALESLQFSLRYDSTLVEWVDDPSVGTNNQVIQLVEAGLLNGLWWNGQWGKVMAQGSEILRLRFLPKVMSADHRQLILSLSDTPTLGEAYVRVAADSLQRWPLALGIPLHFENDYSVIEVKPNPTRADQIGLYLGLQKDLEISLSIYNSAGQEIQRIYDHQRVEPGQYVWALPPGELGEGLYYLRLVASTHQEVVPFVVYN